VLWGLCLVLLAIIPTETVAVWPVDAVVSVTLQVCPAIEFSAEARPLAPVIDADMSNNVHQQRVWICPK
jgi:hypothetical protein